MKMKASRSLRLVGGALAAAVVASPFLFRAWIALPDPPALTPEQAAAALAIARAAATDAPLPAPVALPVTAGPVLVSTYGVDGKAAVGVWDGADGTPLAEALAAAGQQAAQAVAARVRVDVGGAPRDTGDWLLHLRVNPGVDGLRVSRGGKTAWASPSRLVEQGWDAAATVRALAAWLPGEGEPDLARFRTSSWVESPRGPLPVLRATTPPPAIDPQSVRAALADGGTYLARQIGKDGRYCYAYRVDTDRCGRDYNLLRHAGSTYSLYQIQTAVPNRDVVRAAERATDWLRRQVRPVEGDPSRNYLIEWKKAKLGAVGLGILALVERERVVRDGKDRALLTRLADFVLSQQHPDGSLESYFDWGPGAEVPPDRSIYYPGEAMLGLVRLYAIDPQPRWLEAAVRAGDHLVFERWRWAGAEVFVPPDAWLLQAVAELDRFAPDPRRRQYAYDIFETMSRTQARAEEGAPPDLDGAPPSGGRDLPSVTSAGSRSEAAGAAWRLAVSTGEPERAAEIRAMALRAAKFQLRHQLRDDNLWWARNPDRARGGMRDRPDVPEVRIDTVQHNLSGLLDVLTMLESAP